MINITQLNDVEIKKFLRIILSLQLALWGLVFIDINLISIPILRELITFVCLLFVPGVIILRIFKMHNLGTIKTLAYSVGLSISVVMFFGFFINIFYPILGYFKPLSIMNLMLNFSFITLIFCLIAYYRDKTFSNPSFINFVQFPPKFLFIFLVLFLSIFGAYIMNNYHSNIFSMLLVIFISLIILFIGFNKIPRSLYPLTIFIISISLLYSGSLISNNLWGWDIQVEYYYANLVLNNSIWNFMIPANTNAMLSIAMLTPILSIISGLNITWVLKIVFPFLFSLVPVVLYEIFRKETNRKIALFSSLFFILFATSFIEMLQLGKQEIAEFFVVLLLLLLIDNNITKFNKSILLVIFGASLIVSHYGTSYIYLLMFMIFMFLVITFKFLNNKLQNTNFKYLTNLNFLGDYKNIQYSLTFIIFLFVVAFSWYVYVSNSSTLLTVTKIGNHVFNNLSDFLNAKSVQGLSYITSENNSLLHEIAKYIQLISQFFILVGFGLVFSRKEKFKFSGEYILFSFAAIIILLIGLSVPFFASALNTSRVYQLMLIFLSPFCVIGGLKLFNIIFSSIKLNIDSSKIFSIFLLIFLLFNTGFIYEITGDQSQWVSINKNINDHYPIFSDEEIIGAQWLIEFTNEPHNKIYADQYNSLLFYKFGAIPKNFPENNTYLKLKFYSYFGTSNLINQKLPYKNGTTSYDLSINTNNYLNLADYTNGNEIYDDGGSEIFYI